MPIADLEKPPLPSCRERSKALNESGNPIQKSSESLEKLERIPGIFVEFRYFVEGFGPGFDVSSQPRDFWKWNLPTYSIHPVSRGPPPMAPLDNGFTCWFFIFPATTIYKTAFSRSRCRNLKDAPKRCFDINTKLVKMHQEPHGGFSKGLKFGS